MKQLFPRGKRIRPTDKDLVFHTALAALFPIFLLVILLFHIRQIAGTNWQEVSLSQITQDVNIPYLLSYQPPLQVNIINLRLDITHLYYPAKNSFQKGRLKRREIFTELLLYTLTT